MIEPHAGKLVNRLARGEKARELEANVAHLGGQARLSHGSCVALANAEGRRLGVLAIEDIFRPDRQEEARKVFLTLEAGC